MGLIAGVLAKLAMTGPDPGGIILAIVIGIVGAFTSGFIVYDLLGLRNPNSPSFVGSILVAPLGSIILLAIYRLIKAAPRRGI